MGEKGLESSRAKSETLSMKRAAATVESFGDHMREEL
jgi:hypothetical protein